MSLRPTLGRRQLAIAAASLLWAERATATSHHRLLDLSVAGSERIGKRFHLLVPQHTDQRVPLLVLLHGLGETHDQVLGAHAWVERYGLVSSYQRLLDPPVSPVYQRAGHWSPERIDEVNRSLAAQPFRGLAIACPYTPNVYKASNRARLLDEYADWVVSEVVPRARREANVLTDAGRTYLDGCSLGGYVGIEVFLRKAEHFGGWGSVQGALGDHRIAGYAEGLARVIKAHGRRRIHIETSTDDNFRGTNQSFSRLLTNKGVTHDFVMLPGPHDQPFLRDSGTLEMLLWYDRLPR